MIREKGKVTYTRNRKKKETKSSTRYGEKEKLTYMNTIYEK